MAELILFITSALIVIGPIAAGVLSVERDYKEDDSVERDYKEDDSDVKRN